MVTSFDTTSTSLYFYLGILTHFHSDCFISKTPRTDQFKMSTTAAGRSLFTEVTGPQSKGVCLNAVFHVNLRPSLRFPFSITLTFPKEIRWCYHNFCAKSSFERWCVESVVGGVNTTPARGSWAYAWA